MKQVLPRFPSPVARLRLTVVVVLLSLCFSLEVVSSPFSAGFLAPLPLANKFATLEEAATFRGGDDGTICICSREDSVVAALPLSLILASAGAVVVVLPRVGNCKYQSRVTKK